METAPAITIRIEITEAKMGRWIKKRLSIDRDPVTLRQAFAGPERQEQARLEA
jgi:hypothetical protein